MMYRSLIGIAALCGMGLTVQSDYRKPSDAPHSRLVRMDDRREHPVRPRFFIVPARGRRADDVANYCERLVRMVGVARLARSEQEADYILYADAKTESALSSADHTKQVDVAYLDNGVKKTKKQDQKTHTDDILTVSTGFLCRIARVNASGDPIEIENVAGKVVRHTLGPGTPNHGADDRPIHLRTIEVQQLEDSLGALDKNTAQPILLRNLNDLCKVQGPVTEVDAQANRIRVELGSDDGIRDKNSADGVSEMEIYVVTDKTQDFIYQDPDTGRLFRQDHPDADDAPEKRTFTQTDTLRGEPKAHIQGEAATHLLLLGERITDWAEVQEVAADHCFVALKHKGDLGRTQDDTKAVERLPMPGTMPIIARVRCKRGYLTITNP